MKFDEIITIDWYDADVLALVRHEQSESWYLASLLRYDFSEKRRTYVLIPLEDSAVSKLRALLSESTETEDDAQCLWESILANVKSACRSAQGELDVMEGYSLREISGASWKIESTDPDFRARAGQSIDGAVEASLRGIRFGKRP